MDDAGLYKSLRTKLNHLEAKLEAHRLTLQTEFCLYYNDLTRHATPPTVASIINQLQASSSQYKILEPRFPPGSAASSRSALLHPTLTVAAESPELLLVSNQSETPTSVQTLLLASTKTPANSSVASYQAQDSPRERDHELQGLFMPSYIPFLQDSRNLADISPSAASGTAALPAAANNALVAEAGRLPCAESKIMHNNSKESDAMAATEAARPVTPPQKQSKNTAAADGTTIDDPNSSASSEKSDNKAPRSALRRPSSYCKSPLSPRRVRFEFMGAQVLPTSSPQPGDGIGDPSYLLPNQRGEENITVDSILGADLGGDLGLPPRKASSSSALRALSRKPLEDGTVWTVVNPETENTLGRQTEQPNLDALHSEDDVPVVQQVEQNTCDDEDDDAENEGLAMKTKTSAARVKTEKPEATTAKASTSNGISIDSSVDITGEDGLFHFEEEGSRAWSPQSHRTNTKEDSESEDEDADDDSDDAATRTATEDSELATLISPTSVPPTPIPTAKPEPPEPETPTSPRFHVGSVGSYKGRSIFMPIVKNPEILAKASALGNVNSFVGGLDGSSGMDASDMNSYHASFIPEGFTGTPRSLMERLIMEDMAAAARPKNKKDKT